MFNKSYAMIVGLSVALCNQTMFAAITSDDNKNKLEGIKPTTTELALSHGKTFIKSAGIVTLGTMGGKYFESCLIAKKKEFIKSPYHGMITVLGAVAGFAAEHYINPQDTNKNTRQLSMVAGVPLAFVIPVLIGKLKS